MEIDIAKSMPAIHVSQISATLLDLHPNNNRNNII